MLVKDVYAVPIEDAQKEYRKLTNKSNYSQFFGTSSKNTQDFEILRHKKFSSIRIAQTLKSSVIATIERWLGINDQDEYT